MDASRRTSLRTKLARPVVAFVVTAVVALVVAEACARYALGDDFEYGELRDESWTACTRYDAELGWALRSGARVHVAGGPLDYRVRTNAAGFRDPERELAKPTGTRRVVVLGDSMAWGWGIAPGERFGDLLDERLGPEVEVLNLGVPGYGTDQELWVLETVGLAYEPDVVLLGFVLNDVIDARRTLRYELQKPRFVRKDGDGWTVENRPVPAPLGALEARLRELHRSLVARSALASLLSSPARAAPRGPDGDITVDQRRAAIEVVRVGGEAVQRFVDRIDQPGGVTEMTLGRIAALCAEREVALVAVAFPHNHDQHLYNPEAPPPSELDEDVRTSELTRRLAQLGERLGFATVSIDAALYAEASAGRNLDCGDGHYNARGNRVVADVLEPVVRAALSR